MDKSDPLLSDAEYIAKLKVAEEDWNLLPKAKHNTEKGKYFENFCKSLFSILENDLEFVESNILTNTSEIDLLYRRKDPSVLFKDFKTWIIVQAKNRKETTDINDVDHLFSEIYVRSHCNLGILATTSHISKPGLIRIQDLKQHEFTILCMDGADIESVLTEAVSLGNLLEKKLMEHNFPPRGKKGKNS